MAGSGSAVGFPRYPESMRRTAPAAGSSRIPVAAKRDETRHVSAPNRSRLLAMQDAYQKKLMREKEEKMTAIFNRQQEQVFQKLQRYDSKGGSTESKGGNNDQGLVRNFFKERREMEQSQKSGNIISRDAHFQKKLLEKKKTSDLSGEVDSRGNRQKQEFGRPDSDEQRRHEERKEYEMQTYKKQFKQSQVQPPQNQSKGVVRSKPLAPIKRDLQRVKALGPPSPAYDHFETSEKLYDEEDDEMMRPPSKPQKVSHRAAKPPVERHDLPPRGRGHKLPPHPPSQQAKSLNPKKITPPIARGRPNPVTVKKEKKSEFQKWQEEQDLERQERLNKHEQQQSQKKDHFSVDYDRELEDDVQNAKVRRKKEYDDMMSKERELEAMIAKHKEDLAKLTHDGDQSEDEEIEAPPPQKTKAKPGTRKAIKQTPRSTYDFEDTAPAPYHRPTEDDYESRAGEFKSRKKQAVSKPKAKPQHSKPPTEPDAPPPYKRPSPVSHDVSFYERADAEEVDEMDLLDCTICGRRFAADRLSRHLSICEKNASKKKRKAFDSTKNRTEGTELAQYVRKGQHLKNEPPVKPSNWKRKHQDFVKSIQNARETQAYIAKGGKLSDLPPPPPSENPDYKQCPHCGRRFNEAAAERHIPKCKTTKNRPKPLRKK